MDTVLNLKSTEGPDFGAFLARTKRILLEPTRFFRVDFPTMTTTQLLAFGVANAWAAAAGAFFVQTMNARIFTQLLDRWMQQLLSSEDGFAIWSLSARGFLFASGITLLGPFLFLLEAGISGLGLFLFARLLIEDRAGSDPVTYESAVRIRAAVLVTGWFSLVPVFGGLLAFLAKIVLTVTGVRERYGVSTRRATSVVLAPFVLAVFAALLFGALFLVLLSQVPFGEMLDAGDFGF